MASLEMEKTPENEPFLEDIFDRAIDEDGVLGDVLIEDEKPEAENEPPADAID